MATESTSATPTRERYGFRMGVTDQMRGLPYEPLSGSSPLFARYNEDYVTGRDYYADKRALAWEQH